MSLQDGLKTPRRFLRVLSLALCAVTGPTAAQDVFRCEQEDGTPLYTNAPGRNCKRLDLPHVISVPAPRAPVTTPATSSVRPAATAAYPRVEANAQRTRDADRRRILEGELKSEEQKLDELRREFNNGEPERRGDERNYQKYLDRVQRLRDEITRSESNLASLRRELAMVRD